MTRVISDCERSHSWREGATPDQRAAWSATLRKRASRLARAAAGKSTQYVMDSPTRARRNSSRTTRVTRALKAPAGSLRGWDFAAEVARTSMFAQGVAEVHAQVKEGSRLFFRGLPLLLTNGYRTSAFLTEGGEWRPRFLGAVPQPLSVADIESIAKGEKTASVPANAAYLARICSRSLRTPVSGNVVAADLVGMWAAQGGVCALTGARMLQTQGSPFSCVLGRIDSSASFRVGNVRLTIAGVDPLPARRRRLNEDEIIRSREGGEWWDAQAWAVVVVVATGGGRE